MPLRRDNIALARTCSRAFGTYAAPSFQPRLPCLLDLAPLSMSRSDRFIVVMHYALPDGNHFDQFFALLSEYYDNPPLLKTDNDSSILNRAHQKQHAEVNYLKKIGSGEVWASYLREANAQNNLPYIKSQSQGMGIIDFSIATTTINSLSSIFSSSAFNILLLSWGILVSKYCSTNTSCISYPIKITIDHNSLFGETDQII